MLTRTLQNEISRRIYRRNRVFINQQKSRPCFDCKIQYHPWMMQFDHHTANKEFELHNFRKSSLQRLQKEIDKCQVVCANCHADRTYRRLIQGGPDPEIRE